VEAKSKGHNEQRRLSRSVFKLLREDARRNPEENDTKTRSGLEHAQVLASAKTRLGFKASGTCIVTEKRAMRLHLS